MYWLGWEDYFRIQTCDKGDQAAALPNKSGLLVSMASVPIVYRNLLDISCLNFLQDSLLDHSTSDATSDSNRTYSTFQYLSHYTKKIMDSRKRSRLTHPETEASATALNARFSFIASATSEIV